MKSNWKKYKNIRYRRTKETDKAIFVEYTGGEGAYAIGSYSSDREFVIDAVESLERLSKEIESFKILPKDVQNQIHENNRSIYERWQSETGFDHEDKG